jgi:hypothetical protein
MTEIPRSRYEFVLKLYDEQRRLAAAGDKAAALTNVRWTGTMAYAAVEGYERMLTGMRRYRDMKAKGEDTRFVELEIAYAMGWTGHYTGDGAQPLHDTVHHDGWQGDNPKGYTTNPRVHGGAALLRDLAHTAWVRSGEPPVMDPGGNPIVPANPRYNPQTGTAPAHLTTPPGSR